MARTRKLGAIATVLAFAAVVALLALLATGPADAASKYKIVTRTFSKPTPILIPATLNGTASPYPSTINVSGLTRGRILDVDVVLRTLSHDSPDDIDTVVLGPKNTGSARIMSDVGDLLDVELVTMVVDDEAPIFMPSGSRLESARYRPTNYDTILDPFPAIMPNGNRALTVFDGKDPNGLWRFFVVNDEGEQDGQFAGGWSVRIKARVNR